MNNYHIPVMLNEVLTHLNIKPNAWYIDCNLGSGGHTKGILGKGGKVLGIDLDPDAIRWSAENFGLNVTEKDGHLFAESEILLLVQDNFSNLSRIHPVRLATRSVAGRRNSIYI